MPPTPLRLVAFRGGLGVELYEPVSLGPLRVDELTWSLPGLSFPIDLGGGVRAFRHRRGVLQRLVLSIGLGELESWLTQRLERFADLGALLRPVAIWPVPEGLGVGVFGERGVIAADLLWRPQDADGGFVVCSPRGVLETSQPVLTAVLLEVARTLGETQSHDGRVVRLAGIANQVLRLVLPPLGFRLPQSVSVRCGGLEARSDRVLVTFDRGLPTWSMPPKVASAVEFASAALAGDKALLAGDWSEARRAYIAALEQAPRHPELSQTVAAIDAHFEERAEAALGLLVESLPAVEFGLVGAELLARTGDSEGARLAVSKLANHERFPPLCAAYWVKLSEWLTDGNEKAEVIELALAASASSVAARRARFLSRAELGDVHGAVADAEHLEALARGANAKHAVLLECAVHLKELGFVDAAARLFERALRYSPGDPRASLGVALGLIEVGKYERATVVLQRTLELASTDETVTAEANLALGRLLAERAGDLPAAIARVRRVSGVTKTAVDARGYEALWRVQIGDVAGATVAFGRLGEVIARCPELPPHRAGFWLLQAGKYNLDQLGDAAAAERYLALALRRLPKDQNVAETYRIAASRAARRPRLETEHRIVEPPAPTTPSVPVDYTVRHVEETGRALVPDDPLETKTEEAAPANHAVTSTERVAGLSEIELEVRVETLKAQLLASAQLSGEALEDLVGALERLGRLEEAYALLRAQFDDSSGEVQQRLRVALIDVLDKLTQTAHERGAPDDVELYELTRAALDSD